MDANDISRGSSSEPASCFIIEKGGRLIMAVAVADYGETRSGGDSDIRRLFSAGRRSAPLAAIEVAGTGNAISATKRPTKPKSKPKPKPKPIPKPKPKPPKPPIPPVPPPPPPPPPGVGTESPGIGTEAPAIGTDQ